MYSRLLRHALLISLLILRKKPTVAQSKSALKNHIINLFIPQYSYLIAQSTLKMPHNFCFFITPNQKARQSEIKINRLLGISEKMAPTQGIGQFQKISIPNHGRLPCFNPPLPSEIPKCATPPCPQNSIVVNPPSPSEFPGFFGSTFST